MKIIPPFKLILQPLNEDASKMKSFKYAKDEIGTRHQIGGIPDNSIMDKIISCPSCNEEMTFYAQLDSLNDEYNLVDCEMIFVYVCFDCFEVHSLLVSS